MRVIDLSFIAHYMLLVPHVRPLQRGDLVLRVLKGLVTNPRGNFKPNWSGPYIIRELTLEGAAWLDLDGNQFS